MGFHFATAKIILLILRKHAGSFSVTIKKEKDNETPNKQTTKRTRLCLYGANKLISEYAA
jgi:hypothetical protein